MSDAEKTKPESEFAQHLKAARDARMAQVRHLLPKEFWEQGRTARREMLLAMRSLIDVAIDKLEHIDKEPADSKKAKIVVE